MALVLAVESAIVRRRRLDAARRRGAGRAARAARRSSCSAPWRSRRSHSPSCRSYRAPRARRPSISALYLPLLGLSGGVLPAGPAAAGAAGARRPAAAVAPALGAACGVLGRRARPSRPRGAARDARLGARGRAGRGPHGSAGSRAVGVEDHRRNAGALHCGACPGPRSLRLRPWRRRKRVQKRASVGDYVEILKPRIMLLIVITTVGAMGFAAHGWPGTWLLIATVAGDVPLLRWLERAEPLVRPRHRPARWRARPTGRSRRAGSRRATRSRSASALGIVGRALARDPRQLARRPVGARGLPHATSSSTRSG